MFAVFVLQPGALPHLREHAAEVGAGFSLAHAATASLLACVTVLTILETESKYLTWCGADVCVGRVPASFWTDSTPVLQH